MRSPNKDVYPKFKIAFIIFIWQLLIFLNYYVLSDATWLPENFFVAITLFTISYRYLQILIKDSKIVP